MFKTRRNKIVHIGLFYCDVTTHHIIGGQVDIGALHIQTIALTEWRIAVYGKDKYHSGHFK